MRVYRIEDLSGDGPWTSGHLCRAMSNLNKQLGDKRGRDYRYRFNPSNMPGDSDRSEIDHYKKLIRTTVFGFASLTKMRRWFKPALLRELDKVGSQLCIYEVSKVTVTDTQVTFKMKHAELIEARSLV